MASTVTSDQYYDPNYLNNVLDATPQLLPTVEEKGEAVPDVSDQDLQNLVITEKQIKQIPEPYLRNIVADYGLYDGVLPQNYPTEDLIALIIAALQNPRVTIPIRRTIF